MRTWLDRLYEAAGWLAAVFMIGTLVFVLLGIFGRLFGFHVRGTDAYAGYCMAACGFLALAYTLRRNEHIRVTLLLAHVPPAARKALEVWCHVLAAAALPAILAVLLRAARVAVAHVQRHLHRQRRHAALDPAARHGGRHGDPVRRVRRRVRRRAARRSQSTAGGRRTGADRMSDFAITALLIVFLFLLLGTGVWIGLALLGVALIGMELFTTRPVGDAMAVTIWGSSSSWTLTALPLFIWMGEILFRTRLSEDMFRGLAPWMERLPGRLLHTNIIGCAIFAAVSGSSAATCATIGKMTLPELLGARLSRRAR